MVTKDILTIHRKRLTLIPVAAHFSQGLSSPLPISAAGNEADVFLFERDPDDNQVSDPERWIDWLIVLLVIAVAALGFYFFRPR